MTLYTEVLPDTKSVKHRGFKFYKFDAPETPAAGTLLIESPTRQAEYLVEEFPAGWQGRGFQLSKISGGTDADETGYSVFCDPKGRCSCECKGFVRHGHCRHAEAVASCVKEGWL
ncbi:hypothetical protein [Gemmata sp.]|uniref:hypothetical protein n=1 Tax=Gemmata sp. TaxID=1914242 RepID=UPI003F72D893